MNKNLYNVYHTELRLHTKTLKLYLRTNSRLNTGLNSLQAMNTQLHTRLCRVLEQIRNARMLKKTWIQAVDINYIAQPYNNVTKFRTCLCVNPINVNALVDCDYRLSTQDHTQVIEAAPRSLPGSGLLVQDNILHLPPLPQR